MKANELIEASAGTGKTQALAGRLIELLRAGVKPQEIVALTFSRAAAGEIFERFVTLLAEGAETNPNDAKLLREVVATQHLSQIGTLDSFLMRIVRAFPLELGICGKLEMMDEYAAGAERSRVSFSILRRTDAALKRAFADAFALAMNRENVRSFIATYRTFVSAWHERYLSLPDPQAWGDGARLRLDSEGLGMMNDERGNADALSRCAAALEGIVDSDAWRDFVAWVRDFRGSFAGVKGLAKKFLDAGEGLFAGATVEISFSRKAYVFGGAEAAAIRRAMAAVYGYVIRMKLEMARGVYTLVSSFESAYAQKVRNRGRLVFADVPRLIAELERVSNGQDARSTRTGSFVEREANGQDARSTRTGSFVERASCPFGAWQALEYRMDARIRAWALDEFQDTSREQWKALSGLLEEAKQSAGEKSVFVVGDRKQAIYGWRNGDVGIFTGERKSGAYDVGELRKSWRYGSPIVQAINAVFVHGRLRDEFPAWESPEHETAKPDLAGFVQAVESPGPKAADFVEPVYNALAAVDPVRRGLSAAVLVRSNKFGELLAAELRQRGLRDVVWEGESDVLDTPALAAFVDTLALADHPGDKRAYEHFRRSPLAAARYGTEVPDAEALSGEFALAFATKGIVRTFRELRAALPEDPSEAWSDFTESRFTDMLRAAAEFELTLEAGVRLADFVSFLASRTKRNVAEPGKIRIMTIHRSKGLGFDYVVLPLYEHDALTAEPDGPLVGEDWVLPDPGVRVTSVVPGLKDAWRRRKDRVEQEALCTYYVAMTRAKQAMTIVLHPPAKTSTSLRFSEFVREAIPEPIGDSQWYRAEKKGQDAGRTGGTPVPQGETSAPLGRVARKPRRTVGRRLPSLSFHSGESAGSLFAAAGARKWAMDHGTAVHAEYEKLEFLSADRAANALERALTKPEGFVALWREKAFEVLADGEWTSGRFDRVIFTEVGGRRKATVFDFKTNARLRGESEADFSRRLAETYAGQMSAYRRAVVALTGLAPADVSSVLLLTATGAAVPVA